MSSNHRVIVEGIAAIATTAAEMGQTEDDARRQVLEVMRTTMVDGGNSALLLEAADAVTRQPQPPSHPIHEQEQREQIEQMLGIISATDQLNASLRAHEWLRNMAEDLAAGADEF